MGIHNSKIKFNEQVPLSPTQVSLNVKCSKTDTCEWLSLSFRVGMVGTE